VHHALLAAGARTAVDVDGSPAYIAAARAEAERRGTADRVTYEAGDFVAVADRIERADLVALDRVVCCYADWEALVRLSVARARHRYGLVYPRDTWWIRAMVSVINGLSPLARRPYRGYVHPTAGIDSIVRREGLLPRLQRAGLFWQVVVYERPA
jgi:hypothetical protein